MSKQEINRELHMLYRACRNKEKVKIYSKRMAELKAMLERREYGNYVR